MIGRLNVATIYVLDKDEALDFYVSRLSLEKGNDVQQGDYRWLTVRATGDQQTEISLEEPGPPLHDETSAERLRELVTKGVLGGLGGAMGTPSECHRPRSQSSRAPETSRKLGAPWKHTARSCIS